MCWAWSMALISAASLGLVLYLFIAGATADSSPRVSVSGVSLSSFDVSPSSRQLNGTWRIDFSLRYNDHLTGRPFSCDSAAVSVYYKGAYLAGTYLHAFRVPKHPIPLEANVDASRADVAGWLASDLAEARRLGVVEFEVQFVAKFGIEHATYVCSGLRLGFSTAQEAKFIGDRHVRCPLIA